MAESVMRQGMETWLKQECVDRGFNMLNLASWASDTADDMLHNRKDRVQYDLIYFHGAIGELESADRISGEQAVLLHSQLNDIKDDFESHDEVKVARAIHNTLALTRKLDISAMENVVECQCGKPGK